MMLERTSRFMSIMYATLLILVGTICTFFKIDQNENVPRNLFVVVNSIIGFIWIVFWHYDILSYKRWLLTIMKANDHQLQQQKMDNENVQLDASALQYSNNKMSNMAYDSVSLNTAAIFDYIQNVKCDNGKDAEQKIKLESGYRYFQGKHSNDLYLKVGMIGKCNHDLITHLLIN